MIIIYLKKCGADNMKKVNLNGKLTFSYSKILPVNVDLHAEVQYEAIIQKLYCY